ncbi:hypothetical protein EYF80_036836 [Liparis tanakae]|uniref:Uncharacterized protein n=1 Tax=Liparis tanakae TaxID=230148 RepID=A0A4Z2GIE5_9TELE|nr:hypothetical protein EYF80_036836 [Liparis tanakae]
MAVLYISTRSSSRDSNPVAPLGAAGGAEWDVTLALEAVGVMAGRLFIISLVIHPSIRGQVQQQPHLRRSEAERSRNRDGGGDSYLT